MPAKAIRARRLPQAFRAPDSKKGAHRALVQAIDCISLLGAGEANRTPDPNLGKRWQTYSTNCLAPPQYKLLRYFSMLSTTRFAALLPIFPPPAYPVLTRVL